MVSYRSTNVTIVLGIVIALGGCTDIAPPSVPPASLVPDKFCGVALKKEIVPVDTISFVPRFVRTAGGTVGDITLVRLRNRLLPETPASFVVHAPGLDAERFYENLSRVAGHRRKTIAWKEVIHDGAIYHYAVDDMWLMLTTPDRTAAEAFLADVRWTEQR